MRMSMERLEEIFERQQNLEREIKTLAKAKIFERHDAAHKAKEKDANDPRYLASHMEFDSIEFVLGEVEVRFKYSGSLSGQEIVYLSEDEIKYVDG